MSGVGYMRFSGANGAFGWCANGKITLGGLTPGASYEVVCDEGGLSFRADAQGAWSGTLRGAPVCVSRGAQAVLWDESRCTAITAAALISARHTPPRAVFAPVSAPPIPPAEAEKAKVEAPQPKETQPETPPVRYREPSSNPPVDALPALRWPPQAEQLRPYFERNLPVRLFGGPEWRTVTAREGPMQFCFGYRAENDRVCEVLYGVRARGALVPPKGLRGYRYEQAADGAGYWVLRQRV